MTDFNEYAARIQKLYERLGIDKQPKRYTIGATVGSVSEGMRKKWMENAAAWLPEYAAEGYFDRWHKNNPGDTIWKGEDPNFDVSMSLPVAADIWYLTISDSILPFRGDDYQENSEKILGFLSAYTERLDNIKTLKSIQTYQDLRQDMDWSKMRRFWNTDNVPHVIRETRFETWLFDGNTEFPSNGPKASMTPENSLGQLYCGLLSFPVGPLGVMEVISIFSESMGEMIDAFQGNKQMVPLSTDQSVIIENPEDWACIIEPVLEGLLSPMTDLKGKCPGVHLVEKGYLVTNRDAEYPAEPFTGYDKILPFHSMRYYLRRDQKWPIPGEFIGLLAKPFPTHVWWFQETSPFLYAGNWIETNYYTSGVVTEILAAAVGSIYKCVIRGVEIRVASSDFFGYTVGDRVAILRINDLDRSLSDPPKGNFKWKEMEDLIAREKAEPNIVHPNLTIVPISFYES